jgi:Skp family chaperone for outer membrane proteins
MIVVVRRLVLGLALLVLVGGPQAAAQAQPQPGAAAGRIAFVNARALLTGMTGYAKAESTYTKELQNAQSEAQKLQAVLDSAVSTYQQSQAMMSPSTRTAREKVLAAQRDSLEGKLQALQERVGARERELLEPMQRRLTAIIDGIRAEGNYAMVIDLGNPAVTQLIVSYDKTLDITDRVARRLLQSN